MPLAAVMTAPEKSIEVQSLPACPVEEGGILLQTVFSEVCGTDVHLHRGRLSGVPYPIIPGHVSVGRVIKTGGLVRDFNGNPIDIGSMVTFLDVHETCNNCWYCLVAKASTRCPNRKVYGITYSAHEGLLGGWSEQIYLKPGVKILKLPPNLPARRLIAGGCGLPTAIHVVERAEIRLGDLVAVQGSGPVGLNVVILAILSGAGGVMVLGDPTNRLETASEFGADEVLWVSQTSPSGRVDRVRAWSGGRGADITIEATGAADAVKEGLQMTRDGGRYVIAGQYTDAGEVSINPHWDINKKHLDIRGCWGYDFSHFHRAICILSKYGERVGWERMISREYTLSEMDTALTDVEAGSVVKAVVTPNPVSLNL